MATRKVIISVAELIGICEMSLGKYIGVVSHVVDHIPMIKIALDIFLYGKSRQDNLTIKEIILGYGIPSEVADTLDLMIHEKISRLIQSSLMLIYPYRSYEYAVTDTGDILITEYLPELKEQKDTNPSLYVELSQLLEAGGWCNERLRAKAGIR